MQTGKPSCAARLMVKRISDVSLTLARGVVARQRSRSSSCRRARCQRAGIWRWRPSILCQRVKIASGLRGIFVGIRLWESPGQPGWLGGSTVFFGRSGPSSGRHVVSAFAWLPFLVPKSHTREVPTCVGCKPCQSAKVHWTYTSVCKNCTTNIFFGDYGANM